MRAHQPSPAIFGVLAMFFFAMCIYMEYIYGIYIYMEYGECIYSLFGNLKFLCMSLFSRERRERAWMTLPHHGHGTSAESARLEILFAHQGRAVQAEASLDSAGRRQAWTWTGVAVGTCNL